MGSDWETSPLGEVAAVRSGYAFKSSDWTESGVPVVKIANVKGGRLEMAGCSFVDEAVANGVGDFRLSDGDILIAMTGYVGDVARVRKTDLPCVLNQRVGKFTVLNSERLDASYLFLFLASADTRQTIAALGYGSAQPNVSPSLIHKVEIPLPPLPEQKRIAHILGTLDDKIELNRRMNATLEAMSRALFKSWFVDFDPVRQKAAGKQPVGMDAETAALFPDSFEDSELGEVPRGWGVPALSECVELLSGGTPNTRQEEYWGGAIPWFSVKDAPNESDVWVLATEKTVTALGVEKSATKILPPETTIVSARGTVGRLALIGTSMAMNQSCYGIRGLDSRHNLYIYYLLKTSISELQQRTHGTVFDTITRNTFATLNVVDPSPVLVNRFGEMIRPTLEAIRSNLSQSRTLAALRDTLLPKLLSGEIRVPEAEEAVEEAVG